MRRPHAMPLWLDSLLTWLGLVAAMKIVLALSSWVWYPIGGGVFHAMFAYTDVGREGIVWRYAGLIGLSIALTSFALSWLRLRMAVRGIGMAAGAVSLGAWLDVVTWSGPVSGEFRRLIDSLLWVLLPVCACIGAGCAYGVNRVNATARASMRTE